MPDSVPSMSDPVSWLPPGGPVASAPGTVRVYRVRVDAPLGPAALAVLSDAEQARAARFHFEADRRRFQWGRVALRQLLGEALGRAPGEVPLEIPATGKPRLTAPDAALHFNLAHSHERVLIALARDRRVGVDVEAITPDRDVEAIAGYVFSTRELERYHAAHPGTRAAVFFNAWVRKEAVAKACGLGLSALLQRIEVPMDLAARARATVALDGDPSSVWGVEDLPSDPGYALAVAVEGAAGWQVVPRDFAP